ncbi:SurA N-terminal domain-containing protein [Terrihabitans sp. B22-R8]|uniref:SurA N-terminal domain-containing protein n=1 Tax=Terrihabitans sp. B22-R8 TaxID=3425128 RepID=UPI00403D1B2B
MLNAMRRHASGVVMKGFLLLIVLSFVVWGIGDFLGGGAGSNHVAAVGKTRISGEDFRETFNRSLQAAGRQIGRPLTPADARAIGMDRSVLAELMGEATLDENARQLALAVPDEVVANSVTRDETFFGPNGRFDVDRFQQLLRANGLTEAVYVAEQRRLIERRQIIDSVAGGLTAPEALLQAVYQHQNEHRSASYVVLSASSAENISPPADDVLRAFFDERKGAFQAPERRSVSLLAVTAESLSAREQVPDEELRARYEADRARFVTPERRTFQRIPFPSVKEAEAAAAEIANGAPFEDIATKHNVAAADLVVTDTTKDAIIDSKIAESAFSLPQGEISAPVQGQFSTVLLRVLSVQPEVTRSFEDAREEIRHTIAEERGRAALLEVHDRVEDARAGGSTLAEIADREKLPLTKIEAIDRQGRDANGAAPSVAGGEPVLAGAFEAEVGVENDPVQLENSGYVWYEVNNVDPARARTFEEARESVLARWQAEEARQALDAKVEQALTGLKANTLKLPELATREGVEVLGAEGINRRGNEPVLGQAGIAQIFSTPRGGFGSAPAPSETDRIIFQVTKVDAPSPNSADPAIAQVSDRIASSIENDLASQYVLRLQSDYGATVNNQALANALGGQIEN